MSQFIYADNAATTRISSAALAAMTACFTTEYGNPSALYRHGQNAKTIVTRAREEVAVCIGAEPKEIFFTSGGTESDNWALLGGAVARANRGNHIITTAIEHHAVLHTCAAMEKEGYEATYLPVDEKGLVSPAQLRAALCKDTALVSIMTANNEIGTIEPIHELCEIAHEAGALFHTDAVQAAGHIPLNVKELGVDLLSLSGHKFHGPKGVGALFCRKGLVLPPLIYGGGQERGRRSGTENVPGIVGLAAALRERTATLEEDTRRITALRDKLIGGLLTIPCSRLTGHPTLRLPGTASFVFEAVEGESLLLLLDEYGICASSGSACSSASLDPSHVLLAIGLPHALAHGSLRLTIGDETTDAEIDRILEAVPAVVARLRDMSPVWDSTTNSPNWKIS